MNIEELLKKEKLSLMMKEYLKCKMKYKDCILLYRLGDFYEMFFDDAIICSKVLQITLTAKSCGLEEKAPMCGIPHHAINTYINKLIQNGYKVAIGEQLENPSETKTIVKRDVVRVITPGTILDEDLLDTTSNYLMSIFFEEKENMLSLSYVDISVGDIYTTCIPENLLVEELTKIKPSELIISDINLKKKIENIIKLYNIYSNEEFDNNFLDSNILNDYFDNNYINNLKFNLEKDYVKNSIYILLNYIFYTQKKITCNINTIIPYDIKKYMVLDTFTRESLELTKRLKSNEKIGSLYYILDKTNTAMGSRLLKKMIEEPLIYKEDIENRLNYVEEVKNDNLLNFNICEILKNVYDLERLCGKIAFDKINPRELINLKKSIESLPYLKHIIDTSSSIYLKKFIKNLDDLRDIYNMIEESILDEPNINLLEGGIIKPSYNKDLQKYINIIENMNDTLVDLEQKQKDKLKIKSLKIRKNNEGYYMEITKNALSTINLDDSYKQIKDLSNCCRFSFKELKELEIDILQANEKFKSLEYDIFVNIRNNISRNINRIKDVSKILSQIDVYSSLAKVATENNYVRPHINTKGILDIKNGRHAIIENMSDKEFISNSTYMDKKDELIHLITGPNMAGKSTYMRQVVLITLMAQIGSFVPCETANICICDRLFTRIGASDNLVNGQSTFMVEMDEVSQILNNATQNSLIILDEVGRGTSTYDGISLAWSIVEYIQKTIKCHTLFATHYFELTELSSKFNNVKNYTVAIEEINDEVKFLRKIIPGCTNQSYGIYVAQFAKLPQEVIIRAKEILQVLETENKESKEISNLDFNDEISDNFLKNQILSLDLLNMSPLTLFNYIYDLQRKLK